MLVPKGSTSTWVLIDKCMNTDSMTEQHNKKILVRRIRKKRDYVLTALLCVCSDVLGDEFGRQHNDFPLYLLMFSLPKIEQFQHLVPLAD